jgi:vanillate monooxygenase ferredoxin subunit
VKELHVLVAGCWDETDEVKCFELQATDGGRLPGFEPGAHIDVLLQNGLVRQYSLWKRCERDRSLFIGVKLEQQSRGGSAAMHRLKPGDVLAIRPPRNNFPLAGTDAPSLLLAGGIGITPLLAMAGHLNAAARPYGLHLFSRSLDLAPFRTILEQDPGARIHPGLVPPELDRVLGDLIGSAGKAAHLYICGPAPFMELARSIALQRELAPDNIHLEYFTASPEPAGDGGTAFEVVLKRSGKTVKVRADQTIIEAMEEAGVDVLTSCEQGVCGTCVTTVLEGKPDHRDCYFNEQERQSGKLITPCVSRCLGDRLVLDL